MATLDNSPSLFLGQPWTAWADRLPIQDREAVDGAEHSHSVTSEKEVEQSRGVMRLPREDMSLFGICPSKDDFYLAVCEYCGCVIKPQALQKHVELRHAHAPRLPTPTASPLFFPPSSPTGSNDTDGSSSGTTGTPNRVQTQSNNVKLKNVDKMISTAKAAIVRASSPSVRTPSPQNSKSSSTPPSSPKTMPPQIKKNHTAPYVKMAASPQDHITLANLKKTLSAAEKNGNTNSNSNANSNSNSNTVIDKPTSGNTNTTSNTKTSAGKSGSSLGNTSTTSSKKASSPRKLLPCKDREFDANKHCGVWLKDIQKHCTRSLTCKTHALSLRRAVQGRRKPFDELLTEHRARREKELQEKGLSQAKLQQQHKQQLQKQKQQQNQDNHSGKNSAAVVMKTPSPPKTPSSGTSHPHKRPLHPTSSVGTADRQSLSSGAVSTLLQQSSTATDPRSSDGEYDVVEDMDNTCPFVNQQPKPAAVCSFGARLMGRGCYVFNRKTDFVRSAFMSLVERHLNPPPFKKLCVATKSPASSGLGTQAVPVEYGHTTNISASVSAMSGKFTSFVNGPLNKSQNNNKKSKPSNKQSKAKDTHPSSKTKARRKSGGSGGISPANVMPSLNTGSVAIPLSTGNAAGFNISPATYTDMTSNILSASTGNLIKDLSIVVTNIDANVNNGLTPGQVINGVGTTSNPPVLTSTGQLVTSNMSGQLTTMTNPQFAAGQTYQISQTGQQLTAGVPIANINIAANMQAGVINTVSGETKLTNVATAKVSATKSNAKSRSKSCGGSKPSNVTRVHNVWQSPTCTANVNMSRTDNTMCYDANSNGPSSAQPSPSSVSTTPSPHFRPGSISPQMPVQSPLPNGVIPSPSATVNLKGFPVSTINHLHSISPSRNSTPSPITITSSTEASPNNSGQFTSNMFTATTKPMSTAPARVNPNFQKQVPKQSTSVVMQPAQVQHQQHIQLQQPSPQITANIVATGKPLQLNNTLISNNQQLFNMQPVQTIRLPIQQTMAIQHTVQQKTLEQNQTLLGHTDEPM